ncbi:MAG: DNA/RNA non-specific endonuclease [Clostridiales bacterium]|nr:DNA/RNA non-specific endonuclease [Clostridiales bacterium]
MKNHMQNNWNKYQIKMALPLFVTVLLLSACYRQEMIAEEKITTIQTEAQQTISADLQTEETDFAFSLSDVPEYSGNAYVEIHGNIPYFTDEEMSGVSFETYSDLDDLGRCGAAYANIGQDLMPTEKRDTIGQIRPTGWHTVKYDIIDGLYLYNRCHLIAYELTAENANEKNLITGTRYLNVVGMLPFENETAEYIRKTGNHVLYRVTPVFEENNLLASGVLMEAKSVEDGGEGICFCVYLYNVQPGIDIDYTTGENKLAENAYEGEAISVIMNTNSKKYHDPDCEKAADIKESNRQTYNGTREILSAQAYTPCQSCNP